MTLLIILCAIACLGAYLLGDSHGNSDGYKRGCIDGNMEGRKQLARENYAHQIAQEQERQRAEDGVGVLGVSDTPSAPLPPGAAQVLKENTAAINELGGGRKTTAPDRSNRRNRTR